MIGIARRWQKSGTTGLPVFAQFIEIAGDKGGTTLGAAIEKGSKAT
jgi:hypothetical protein